MPTPFWGVFACGETGLNIFLVISPQLLPLPPLRRRKICRRKAKKRRSRARRRRRRQGKQKENKHGRTPEIAHSTAGMEGLGSPPQGDTRHAIKAAVCGRSQTW